MHTFRGNEGSKVRLEYGFAVAAALRCDAETKHLVGAMEEANRALKGAWFARLGAMFDEHGARAELRMRWTHLTKALGALRLLVRSEARVNGSALERELFPDGPEGARASNGPDQLALAEGVRDRLAASQDPQAEAVRRAYQANFAGTVEAYGAAVAKVAAAVAEVQRLRALEMKARADHSQALSLTEAGILALFPNDPKRRASFEPRYKSTRRGVDRDDPPESADLSSPAAPPKPDVA